MTDHTGTAWVVITRAFRQSIKKLGFDWLINLKRNQPELLAESERAPAAQAPHLPAVNQFDELRLWYAPQVDWSAADRDIGVVKTVRTHVRRVHGWNATQPETSRRPENRWSSRAPTSTPPICNWDREHATNHQEGARASAVPIPRRTPISKNRSVLALTALAMSLWVDARTGQKKPLTLDEFFNAVDFTKIAVSPDGHMVVIATDRADWKNERAATSATATT